MATVIRGSDNFDTALTDPDMFVQALPLSTEVRLLTTLLKTRL